MLSQPISALCDIIKGYVSNSVFERRGANSRIEDNLFEATNSYRAAGLLQNLQIKSITAAINAPLNDCSKTVKKYWNFGEIY